MVFSFPLHMLCFNVKPETTSEIMLRVLEEAGCDPSTVIVDFECGVELAHHTVFGDPNVEIPVCTMSLYQTSLAPIVFQRVGTTNFNVLLVSQPTVMKLIACLRAECARVSVVLLQQERGIRPKK